MKLAVIIKHPFRDHDWRVDLVDVPDDTDVSDVRTVIAFQTVTFQNNLKS